MKKAAQPIVNIESISDLHDMVKRPRPRHPLISVVDHTEFYTERPEEDSLYRFGFYAISCKKFEGLLHYGKSHYDFREGSLMFTAPGQVIGAGPDCEVHDGWAMFIHHDFLHGTALGRKMHEYSFFTMR